METRKTKDNPLPIISWCGSDDTADIVLPTYDITRSTLETLRGVTNDLLSIQGQTGRFDYVSFHWYTFTMICHN